MEKHTQELGSILFDRALADSKFRHDLLHQPAEAIAKVLHSRPKRVVLGEQQRELLARLLEHAAAHPGFAAELAADPKEAMRAAGHLEAYEEIQQWIRKDRGLPGHDMPCVVWSQCKCFAGSVIGVEL